MMIPPRLRHLRTDKRGRPVPFINRWGAEDATRLAVRDDPWVKSRAVYDLDADETVPDFTAQNFQRQRECVVSGCCQVCASPVSWSARYLVVSGMSVQTIEVDGVRSVVTTEPWLDRDCALFAVLHCPGLIRRERAEDLALVPISSPDQCQLVMSTGWFEGPLERETRRHPVAVWAKIHVDALVLARAGVHLVPSGGPQESNLPGGLEPPHAL